MVVIGVICYFVFTPSSDEVGFPRSAMAEATPVAAVGDQEQVRVILFTGTQWCGACKHLERTVVGTEGWRDFASREINFQVHDIPADRASAPQATKDLIAKYGIRAYPTMVVVDREGTKISAQEGSGAPLENYKHWIREHSPLMAERS